VVGIKKFDKKNIKIEMINGTFYLNCVINLINLIHIIQKKYSYNEIFITKLRKSPISLSIKLFSYFDETKKKNKIPTVFIYNTGSVNIIATSYDMLFKTFDFIKDIIQKNFDDIAQKKIILNDNFF